MDCRHCGDMLSSERSGVLRVRNAHGARVGLASWLACTALLGLVWASACNNAGGDAATPYAGGGSGTGDASGGAAVTLGTGGSGAGGATALGAGGSAGGVSGSGGASTGGAWSSGGSGTGGQATGGMTGTGGRGAGGAPGRGGIGPDASAGGGPGGAAGGGSSGNPNDLWIATDGSDANPGTEAQPFKTLSYAHAKASAGITIWIKPGTYQWDSTVSLSKSGTASSPINIFAAAGARPVLDFSAQPRDDSSARGIKISGDYWHITGIDVINAGDNCIAISGAHNTIEWVSVHGCCDTGIQISADSSQASDASRAAYNTILNCDAYENVDQATGGENADGFAAKLHIGPGNVFKGCRSWNNADDGWDLFASDDIVTIDDCWAFLNGKLANGGGTSNGDGNGFKLGGAAAAGDAYEGGAPHKLTNCFAFENLACGFTRNNNTEMPVLSSCGGRSDGKGEYCSLDNPSPIVSFTMTSAQAKAVQRDSAGNLPAIK